MVLARKNRVSPRESRRANLNASGRPRYFRTARGGRAPGFINFRLTAEFSARGGSTVLARDDETRRRPCAKDPGADCHRFQFAECGQADARRAHSQHDSWRLSRPGCAFCWPRRVTDNHIGDWGTQFGRVIYGWKHLLDEAALEQNADHRARRDSIAKVTLWRKRTSPCDGRSRRTRQASGGDAENTSDLAAHGRAVLAANSRNSTTSWGFALMSGWAKASTMTRWLLSVTGSPRWRGRNERGSTVHLFSRNPGRWRTNR